MTDHEPMDEWDYADRYHKAQHLCGGEDPVEALGRIAEATGYARALQAERASNPEEDRHFLLSEHVADRLRDSEARDSLLDLVQRLLDHSPGGRDPYLKREMLTGAYVTTHPWTKLREEARARMAEMKGESDA